MNKKLILLAALCACIGTGCTNVRTVGDINGLIVTRVTTRGVFSPSTTSIVLSNPNKPGTIDAVVVNGTGPGLVPAVANAGGVAAGAALLRPAHTHVSNESSASGGVANGGTASSGSISSGGNTQNGSIHHNN